MKAEQDLAHAAFLRKDQAIALIRTFGPGLVDITPQMACGLQPISADLAH